MENKKIKLTVRGTPKPQTAIGLAQAVKKEVLGKKFDAGYGGRPSKPPNPLGAGWMTELVKTAVKVKPKSLFRKAIRISIDLYFPRWSLYESYPEGAIPYGVRTASPDADNLAKPVMDALSGVIYHDDSQITDLRVRKFICEKEGSWRTEIEIEELPNGVSTWG